MKAALSFVGHVALAVVVAAVFTWIALGFFNLL
jgi:hypothetical protein